MPALLFASGRHRIFFFPRITPFSARTCFVLAFVDAVTFKSPVIKAHVRLTPTLDRAFFFPVSYFVLTKLKDAPTLLITPHSTSLPPILLTHPTLWSDVIHSSAGRSLPRSSFQPS